LKKAAAISKRTAFVAVEHAMNVLIDGLRLQDVVKQNGLIALIRSTLAMS